MRNFSLITFGFTLLFWSAAGLAKGIVHDAEYYILEAQNGEKWSKQEMQTTPGM